MISIITTSNIKNQIGVDRTLVGTTHIIACWNSFLPVVDVGALKTDDNKAFNL